MSTVDVVLEIAKRMANPDVVDEKMSDPANANHDSFIPGGYLWSKLALSDGYPSMVLLFTTLRDEGLLDLTEEAIIHNYVLKIKETLEKEGLPDSLSLFSGVSGICFAIQQASLNGTRYQRILDTLHNHLIKNIESHYLTPIRGNISRHQPSFSIHYDLIQGLCGIGRYAIHNISDPQFSELAYRITKTLVNYTEPLLIEKTKVPGWYLAPNDPLNNTNELSRSKGNFNLGLAHGVSGILAYLSIAYLNGIIVEKQKETIQYIAEWICQKSFVNHFMIRWPYHISWEEEIKEKTASRLPAKDAWCYGVPGITRSLFIAGKAIGNKELKNFAANAFRSIFNRSYDEWNIPGPSICHGIAGLLMITHEMSKEIGLKDLKHQLPKLKELLLSFLNFNYVFGFKDLEPTRAGGYAEVSKAGILEGATGILLSLLTLEIDKKLDWHLPLLIYE